MAPHPSDLDLRAFNLGHTDPSGCEAVAAHLERCPACCERLEHSDDSDGFVLQIRRSALGVAATEGDRSGPTAFWPASPAGGDHPRSLGDYRLERVLGQGGMGVVYLARDERLGRHFALKTMRPEFACRRRAAERFLREARSAARIEHDHVVPIWQVGEDSGVPFIAMPLLRGESLADRLARESVAPLELTLQVGIEVAEGLAAAHQLGVIHRDIKPQNIWLEADPGAPSTARCRRCKILDFGLARAVDDDPGLTAPEQAVGSPGFMSPEQARSRPLDHRTDLFSLGVVLYRMAAGRMPFEGSSPMAQLTSLAVDRPGPPPAGPACPPALSAMILRLLARDPADRPASAREVAEALRGLGAAGPAPAAEASRVPRPPRRTLRALGLVAAAGLAAVAGGIVITIRHPDGRETRVEVPVGSVVRIADEPPASPSPPAPPAASADRRPAEDLEHRAIAWALGRGGRVAIMREGLGAVLAPGRAIPDGPIALVGLDLADCQGVDDSGLAHLRGLARLEDLNLHGTGLTDAGLAHVAGLARLRTLNLTRTGITDEGLAHLSRLAELRRLDLAHMPLTGAGLRHLSGATALAELFLQETALEGARLLHLRRMAGLRALNLAECRGVTDGDLAPLRDLSELEFLNLHGTEVSDDGLGHLAGLARLRLLNLSVTHITDDGLARLAGLAQLRSLYLYKTPITGSGLRHLAPLTNLTGLFLGASRLVDAELANLREVGSLRTLSLREADVSDVGLAGLAGMSGLTYLDLHQTRVTDDGLAHLEGLSGLARLDLSRTRVTPAGLLRLRALPGLRELQIPDQPATSPEVQALRRALPGCVIGVASS